MTRSTAIALAGVALPAASVTVPFAALVTSQWDTDYVYTVETNDTYCASVVHETPTSKVLTTTVWTTRTSQRRVATILNERSRTANTS